MQVVETRSYDARLVQRALVRGGDGLSSFKSYRLDIVGRENPERYEWGPSGLDPERLRLWLASQEGVGWVTAFPHITKLFRFDPAVETVLTVRAFRTPSMEPLDLGRPEGFVEFACLAEALIAADEYRLWARAPDVSRYLASWSRFRGGAVRDHSKLRRHWR